MSAKARAFFIFEQFDCRCACVSVPPIWNEQKVKQKSCLRIDLESNFRSHFASPKMDAKDSKQYWLLKVEPSDYPWSKMVADTRTTWNGIRNMQAQKYMRTMKHGDLAFYYHTEAEKSIVGIVEVVKEFYTNEDDDKFGMVDVQWVRELKRSIPLAEMKSTDKLSDMTILRQPRLSVSAITPNQWKCILELSES